MDSTPNFENRTLFQGDNLKFLQAINSDTIDLIATDPPFNKGKDFHATPDSLAKGANFQDQWHWDMKKGGHGDWVKKVKEYSEDVYHVIEGSRKSYGDDMGAFLCFIGARLLEMQRILKDTGSIYLHCDPTASHYLKELMDAIFGKENFRNEIIWQYGSSGRGAKARANHFPRNHDVILYYAKDHKKFKHNPVTEYDKYPIKNLPSHIKNEDKIYFKTSPRGDYTDKSIEKLRKENRIYTTKNGSIRIKYFLEADNSFVYEPKICGSVWDIPDMMHSPKIERRGYPTQKPLALYRRIIKASSNPGDVVLDPFCGCATTLVAAEQLRRQWIGIDIWEGSHDEVLARLADEHLANKEGIVTGKLGFGDIEFLDKPPTRTDDGDEAAPYQRTVVKYNEPLAKWQKLSTGKIREYLAEAQASQKNEGWVVCPGCGRDLETPFMELDHIQPKSDSDVNDISNRILMCKPCNQAKSNKLAFQGLWDINNKTDWMKDENKAKRTRDQVSQKIKQVKREVGV